MKSESKWMVAFAVLLLAVVLHAMNGRYQCIALQAAVVRIDTWTGKTWRAIPFSEGKAWKLLEE
jgi:hypothetical protein